LQQGLETSRKHQCPKSQKRNEMNIVLLRLKHAQLEEQWLFHDNFDPKYEMYFRFLSSGTIIAFSVCFEIISFSVKQKHFS